VKRVKTAKGRKVSSTRWLERQLNDPYVAQAKKDGYRSRAAYKLIELDERFHFLRGVRAVVDLGIAPGGWAQVVRKQCPKAAVAGIDLLEVDPGLPPMLREVLGPAGGQVVDHHDRVAAFDQQVDHVAADEPRPSGDDRARHRSGQSGRLDGLDVVVAGVVERVRDTPRLEGVA